MNRILSVALVHCDCARCGDRNQRSLHRAPPRAFA